MYKTNCYGIHFSEDYVRREYDFVKYSVSERAYEYLKLLKGKEVFVDIIWGDGLKIYFNSKKFKVTKEGSAVTIESVTGCGATFDLNIIEHYSCVLNAEDQCEQTTLVDKHGNTMKVYLPIKEKQDQVIATFEDEFGQQVEFSVSGDE